MKIKKILKKTSEKFGKFASAEERRRNKIFSYFLALTA